MEQFFLESDPDTPCGDRTVSAALGTCAANSLVTMAFLVQGCAAIVALVGLLAFRRTH